MAVSCESVLVIFGGLMMTHETIIYKIIYAGS